MKNLSEFAQFLSDRDKNFYNMDKQDIDAFLLNKKVYMQMMLISLLTI